MSQHEALLPCAPEESSSFQSKPINEGEENQNGGDIHGSGLLREQQLAGAQRGLQEMPNTDKGKKKKSPLQPGKVWARLVSAALTRRRLSASAQDDLAREWHVHCTHTTPP